MRPDKVFAEAFAFKNAVVLTRRIVGEEQMNGPEWIDIKETEEKVELDAEEEERAKKARSQNELGEDGSAAT